MRIVYSIAILFTACTVLSACGDDGTKELVKKPNRPNPFPGYERQIRYAKDWHRLSHHLRAIVIGHWSHDAGFTKDQSNTLIWCLKELAEADDAATKTFADARSACMAKAKANAKS